MNKRVILIMWLLIGITLLIFSDFLNKNQNIASVINIIGCLILVKLIIKTFHKMNNRKATVWIYLGVIAFLVAILIDLVLLSL